MLVQLIGGCGCTRDTSVVVFEYRVEFRKQQKKKKILFLLDFVLNFKVAKTSNVKKKFSKMCNQKKPKSAVEFLTFKMGV